MIKINTRIKTSNIYIKRFILVSHTVIKKKIYYAFGEIYIDLFFNTEVRFVWILYSKFLNSIENYTFNSQNV